MALTVSDGYVIYTRGESTKSPYWAHVHKNAVAEASNIQSLYDESVPKREAAGQRLISLGQAEQLKELELINRATGANYTSVQDIKIFIQNFNQILTGKKQFEATLIRLKSALQKVNQGKGSRAPTIASWFTNALGTALNKNINSFITGHLDELQNKVFSSWEESFNGIINTSIDEALKSLLTKMEQKENKEMYGDVDSWKQIYEASQQIQGFNQYFQEMIRSKFDFNKIRNILQDENVKINNKSHRGIRKIIDSKQGLNLRNEKKSRAIGGSVQEYIENIVATMGQAAQSAVSSGGRVASSEMMKTDNFTIFSYEQKIDTGNLAQSIADSLNETMLEASSLNEAAQLMENFNNQYLSSLNDSFIVYGSTKSYALTNSFAGFHGGGARSLEDAKYILSQAGFNLGTVSDFINKAYNTSQGENGGAIFANDREEISEQLETALAGAVANLLFDDWTTIGEQTNGAKAIHVMQLDALQIPLSVFLIAAGQAMVQAARDSEQFIRIRIQLPNDILYPEPIETEGGHMSEILDKWNEQAQAAKNESSFTLVFLKNFKQMITEWVNF